MDAMTELEAARDRVLSAFHGIGKPIVRIPIEQISVYTDADGPHATMTYDDLIALVKRALQ
jgi:hypothetical protein